MATSGSKSIAVTSWDTLKFSWEQTGQSIASNTTTINWKLQLISTGSGRIDSSASKSWSVTVNGTKYSGTNTVGIANNTTKTLASGNTTISHNSDGTKTFSYSFSQQFDITFSGSKIGTKSGSGSGTLNTIPRKSTLAANNGTLNVAQILTVTRKSDSFTHTITYKCGSASGTIVTKSTDTSITWTPPLSLASQNTSGTSVSITFTITSYNGSTSLGSNTKTITCSIPSSIVPSVSIAVSDALGYSGTHDGYIQGLSKIKVVVTDSGAYGSTIKSRKTVIEGKTYTAASFTTDVIKSLVSVTIKTTVTDSRGRSASTTQTVTVQEYAAPKISDFTVYRSDAAGNSSASGNYLAIKFSSYVYPLAHSTNSVSRSVRYKKTTETEYTEVELTNFKAYQIINGIYTFPAETSASYEIIFTVADSFSETTKTANGASIFKLFSILKQGLGFAIGKIAELEGVLDVGFKTRFSGGIMPIVLPVGTDVNDLFTPNQYIGMQAEDAGYLNLPFESNTSFTLEVLSAGEVGQVMQRCTLCRKVDPIVYERFYYQSAWGEWVKVSDFGGKLLWSGGYYMTEMHNISLAEKISEQKNGIVLVFSAYSNGAAQDYSFNSFFVSKRFIKEKSGFGNTFIMASNTFGNIATKYLYINDASIAGNEHNDASGTSATGITYNNTSFVLRYVIGV